MSGCFGMQFVFFGHIADLKNSICEDAVINQTESIILYGQKLTGITHLMWVAR